MEARRPAEADRRNNNDFFFNKFRKKERIREVTYHGIPYTWCNNREGVANVRERIDRVLMNLSFMEAAPYSNVIHKAIIGSDYAPLLLSTVGLKKKRKKPFRFESMWTLESSCEETINKAWNSIYHTNHIFSLQNKMQVCAKDLQQWSKETFGSNKQKIMNLQTELCLLQALPATPDNMSRQRNIVKDLEDTWLKEELYWHQRSRVSWLNFGDQNTRFFHLTAMQRGMRNRIEMLKNGSGIWLDDPKDISDLVLNHFSNIYASSGSRDLSCLDVIEPMITDTMRLSLETMVHPSEITKAVKGMGAHKAPGEDGFSGIFFQKYWHIVGKSVTEAVEKNRLATSLGVKKMEKNTRYLGLPSVFGRKKSDVFDFILEKVLGKMQGWKQKLLTQTGREVLIKSVIQSIPSYAMQCYLLSRNFLDKLMVYIRRFFWHGDSHENHIHWLAWEQVCCSKDRGGLGFRDLRCFNMALLAKQGWRLLINPQSFWARVLKGLYYPNSNFLVAKAGSRPSWLWQSILYGRELLLSGVRWQVGSGENILFWSNKWIPYNEDFYVRYPRGPFAADTLVSDFIRNGEWLQLKLQQVVSNHEADIISSIPISQTGGRDRLVWHYDTKGSYTVKTGFWKALNMNEKHEDRASTSSNVDKLFWRQIWNLKTLPKIKNFWWRACKNAIATKENLYKRKCSDSPLCPICCSETESIEHTLLRCPCTKVVWFGSSLALKLDDVTLTLQRWTQNLLDTMPKHSDKVSIYTCVINIAWQIWKMRNEFVFNGIAPCPKRVLSAYIELRQDYEKAGSTCLPDNNVSKTNDVSDTSSQTWIPPTNGHVKLNCDASFKDYIMATGIIARDYKGSIIFCTGKKQKAESVLAAELLAVRHACLLASQFELKEAIIESESAHAIKLSSSEGVPPWNSQVVVEDIKSIATRWKLQFAWTARNGNKAAHEMAKFVFNSDCSFLWTGNFPDVITSILRSELNE